MLFTKFIFIGNSVEKMSYKVKEYGLEYLKCLTTIGLNLPENIWVENFKRTEVMYITICILTVMKFLDVLVKSRVQQKTVIITFCVKGKTWLLFELNLQFCFINRF